MSTSNHGRLQEYLGRRSHPDPRGCPEGHLYDVLFPATAAEPGLTIRGKQCKRPSPSIGTAELRRSRARR